MIEYSQSHSDEKFKLKVIALKALSSLLLGAYRALGCLHHPEICCVRRAKA
jgi:hypothetical protein